jgi:hypothetical protein
VVELFSSVLLWSARAWIAEKNNVSVFTVSNIICGLVVSVADYKHRGPGFDSRALRSIFLRELGLQRGPLSLVIG